MKGGFYKLRDANFKKNIVSIVSREARGFLYASFFGGLCGGVVGGFFAGGVTQFIIWLGK